VAHVEVMGILGRCSLFKWPLAGSLEARDASFTGLGGSANCGLFGNVFRLGGRSTPP
jgi:hypothetical protein